MNLKKNTIWNIVEVAISFTVALIVTRLFIQNYGMNEYGLFVTLTLLSGYGIISLFDLGMTGAAVTFAARYRNLGLSNELRMLWFFCLFYFFTIAVLAFFIISTLIFLDFGSILYKIQSSRDGLKMVFPSLLLTFLSFFSFVFVSFLQAFELYKSLQLVNVVSHLTRLLAAAYFLPFQGGPYNFFWAMVVIKLLSIIVLFIILILSVNELKYPIRPSFKLVREWVNYSLILFGSAIVGFFMNMLDKVLISSKLPFTDVGRYDVANKPANGLRMGLSVLYSALEPATVRSYVSGGIGSVRRLYNKSTFYICFIIFPLIIVSLLNMENILKTWLGSSDTALVYLAIAAACYLIVVIHASVANVMLVAVGVAGKILPLQIFSAFIVFILMTFLIGTYGLYGCVIAIFSGYLLSSILILRYFYIFFKYETTGELRSIIFDSIFIFFTSITISWLFKKINLPENLKLYELIFIFVSELTIIYIVLYAFFMSRLKK